MQICWVFFYFFFPYFYFEFINSFLLFKKKIQSAPLFVLSSSSSSSIELLLLLLSTSVLFLLKLSLCYIINQLQHLHHLPAIINYQQKQTFLSDCSHTPIHYNASCFFFFQPTLYTKAILSTKDIYKPFQISILF